MQDREQIQKEIDAVRLQLSIVDTAVTTAPEDEKEHWGQKRITLQTRLEALQRDLAMCKGIEDDNAVPVFDDDEATAMFNQIIYAQESSGSDAAPAEPQEQAEQPRNPEVVYSESGVTGEYASTDELFSRFFNDIDHSGGDVNKTQEPVTAEPVTADGAIIMGEPIVSDTPITADAPILADEPEQSDEAFVTEETVISEGPVVANEPDIYESAAEAEKAEEVKTAPRQEVSTQELFADLQRTLLGLDEEEPAQVANESIEQNTVPKAENAAPQSDDEADGQLKLDITDSLREAIAAAAQSIQSSDYAVTGGNGDLRLQMLRAETEDANRRAKTALAEAEKLRAEAEKIKLAAETERAMYAAEMELQRGLRSREEAMREAAMRAERDKLNEKIARRKAEITQIRNGLQDVKDSESAFIVREKLFSVQLVLDEDERNSPEISYLLTKSLDDLSHALEVAELKRRIVALTNAAKKAAAAQKAAAARKAAAAKKAAQKRKKAEAKKKKAAAAKARRRPPIRGYARMFGRPPMRYYPGRYR